MLVRSNGGHQDVSTDDAIKAIKKLAGQLPKLSDDAKLDALVDITELSKVMIDILGISNDEYFKRLNERRVQFGTFAKEEGE